MKFLGVIVFVSLCLTEIYCAVSVYPSTTCRCASNLDPVCGSNGRMYDNECLFICEATRDRDLKVCCKGRCGDCRGGDRVVDYDIFMNHRNPKKMFCLKERVGGRYDDDLDIVAV